MSEVRVDEYPSRVDDRSRIMERKDPVIYTNRGEKAGPLSAEQLDFYEKNGYLFLSSFFSVEETEALRRELFDVLEAYRTYDVPEVVREPDSDEVRSVFSIHQTNERFQRLARDERIVASVQQILGSDLYITQSRINFKPGFKGKEFYWHSDFETWHVEDGMPRMRAVSCSIILEDNHVYNGPLMLVPGSHQYFVSCAGETPEDNYRYSLRRQEVGVPDEESLTWLVEAGGIDMPTGAKGSVLLFDCNVMHGSNANLSPYPRSNVFMVYNSVENALEEPFSGLKPRPPFLAARDVVPVGS